MVRYIHITHEKGFRKSERQIINLGDFIGGKTSITEKADVFDDMDYWDSEKDLNGKTVREVELKIIEYLQNKGFSSRTLTEDDKNSITIPRWMRGHRNKTSGIGQQKLDNIERTSILMFHLINLLETAKEYDDEYYFHLDI